jgi:hypothetical protein
VEFVLAAVRRDADAARAQSSAACRVDDWAAVAGLARAHDVGWWVMRALPPVVVPEAVRAVLAGGVRDVALDALAGARQLAELIRVLADAHVRAVAYKGPALAADVHGDAGARRFTDLDLLIAEADRDRAVAAARAAGYVSPAGYTPREERVYSRWEGATQLARGADWPVELHWRCQAPRYGGPQDPADVVARARPCALGGDSVPVPSPEDLTVLLALHGVKHAWTSLLWSVDFLAAASRPALDWAAVVARADAWGVRRALRYALLVSHELLALDVPASLLADACGDARAAFLAHAAAMRLAGEPTAADVGSESTPRYDLQWIEGAWARARYLALAVTLPTPQDRKVARFPDALLPLAYPVRAVRLLRRALRWRA